MASICGGSQTAAGKQQIDLINATTLQNGAYTSWLPNIETKLLGVAVPGKMKFCDTVLSGDGHTIVGVPLSASSFMGIDSDTGGRHVTQIGPKLEHKRSRLGGAVLGLDGFLYCAPLRANRVLRLDTLAIAELQTESNTHNGDFGLPTSFKTVLGQSRVSAPHRTAASEHAGSEVGLATFDIMSKSAQKIFTHFRQEIDAEKNSEKSKETGSSRALSMAEAGMVLLMASHWRQFASKRAREKYGFCARDRVVGHNDLYLKSILSQEPDSFAYALTLLDSPLSYDLCDWFTSFSNTVEGLEFIETCKATNKQVDQVAATPNLTYSLVASGCHKQLLLLPVFSEVMLKPAMVSGNWLSRLLLDKQYAEDAVEFIEILSNKFDANRLVQLVHELVKHENLLVPMLRLPRELQERLVKSKLLVTSSHSGRTLHRAPRGFAHCEHRWCCDHLSPRSLNAHNLPSPTSWFLGWLRHLIHFLDCRGECILLGS